MSPIEAAEDLLERSRRPEAVPHMMGAMAIDLLPGLVAECKRLDASLKAARLTAINRRNIQADLEAECKRQMRRAAAYSTELAAAAISVLRAQKSRSICDEAVLEDMLAEAKQ